ncbi:MAG: MFS transporter [Lachnospiraceae bacterium]|nr:MFS transporter [Lachnospiraceae bacterium]
MIISQASQISQRMMSFSRETAALTVSVIALCNTAGRLASGSISDRIGSTAMLKITFIGSFAGSLLLFLGNAAHVPAYYAGLALIGFCFGGIMGIYPAFTAEVFGSRNNSVNYGIMFIGFAAPFEL